MTPTIQDLLKIQVECKARGVKSFPLYDYMDQAKKHGPHEPVVIVKSDRKKPLAVVDMEYFFNLLTEAKIKDE